MKKLFAIALVAGSLAGLNAASAADVLIGDYNSVLTDAFTQSGSR